MPRPEPCVILAIPCANLTAAIEQTFERGAFAFLYKPFNAPDIDRELHALFGLRPPLLAGVEPMRFARASVNAPAEVQW